MVHSKIFKITTREEHLPRYFSFFKNSPTLVEIDEREISDSYNQMVNWMLNSLWNLGDNHIIFLWNDERRTMKNQLHIDSADRKYNLEERGPTEQRLYDIRYDRPYRFYFEDESDALAFKLRWG